MTNSVKRPVLKYSLATAMKAKCAASEHGAKPATAKRFSLAEAMRQRVQSGQG